MLNEQFYLLYLKFCNLIKIIERKIFSKDIEIYNCFSNYFVRVLIAIFF